MRRFKSRRRRCPFLLETIPAKHRTSLPRPERHCRVFAAFRTHGAGLDSGETRMPYGRRSQNGYAFCFAGFAALGFVGELLIVEEHLLPGREQEIHSAVRARQHLIPEFHRGCSLALSCPHPPASREIVHLSRRTCAQDFRSSPSVILPPGFGPPCPGLDMDYIYCVETTGPRDDASPDQRMRC
jgi:hypothetical protein